MNFSMLSTCFAVPALSDNPAILDDNRPHQRVGTGPSSRIGCNLQGLLHILLLHFFRLTLSGFFNKKRLPKRSLFSTAFKTHTNKSSENAFQNNVFSHPDCTVGPGIQPDRAKMACGLYRR
jgi:hypothetical protein